MIALQYIGAAIIAALIVWGLFSAYWYVKLSIKVAKSPHKQLLLQQLTGEGLDDDDSRPMVARLPGPDGIPGPLNKPMSPEEIKAHQKKYVETGRRRSRHHDAVMMLMGRAAVGVDPKGAVAAALALSEELERQNAERPLPEAKDDEFHHDLMRGD